MSRPAIVSTSGGALSADEIDAAMRVANTNKHSKVGIVKVRDVLTGVDVEYHPFKNIAFTSSLISYFYSGLVEQDLDGIGQLISTAQVLSNLDAGELSPGFLRAAVKRFHPISFKISVPSIPVLEYEDSVLEGSIEDLDTLPGLGQAMPTETLTTVKIQRVTTISYLGPDGHTKSETYTGSYQYTATLHSDGVTPQYIWTVNKIFTGQYVDLQASDGRFMTNVTGINSGERAFLVDGYTTRTQELGCYIEGDAIQLGLAGTGNYVFPLETSQDATGRSIIPALKFPISGASGIGSEEGTPYPYRVKTLPILQQYRSDYKPKFTPNSPDQRWQDSSMTEGEIVTIYPVQYTSTIMGDFGLYPTDEEREQATGIYLTKGYKYKYSYIEGAFEFNGTVRIKDKRTSLLAERVDLPPLSPTQATIEDVLALGGLSSVEELYLAVGVTTEAELLAIFGFTSIQEYIDLVIPPVAPRINFIFKSTRTRTGWKDVDELYNYQGENIRATFDESQLTLEGLYEFLR